MIITINILSLRCVFRIWLKCFIEFGMCRITVSCLCMSTGHEFVILILFNNTFVVGWKLNEDGRFCFLISSFIFKTFIKFIWFFGFVWSSEVTFSEYSITNSISSVNDHSYSIYMFFFSSMWDNFSHFKVPCLKKTLVLCNLHVIEIKLVKSGLYRYASLKRRIIER